MHELSINLKFIQNIENMNNTIHIKLQNSMDLI